MISVVLNIKPVQMLLLPCKEGFAEEQAHAQQPQHEPIAASFLQRLPVNGPFGFTS